MAAASAAAFCCSELDAVSPASEISFSAAFANWLELNRTRVMMPCRLVINSLYAAAAGATLDEGGTTTRRARSPSLRVVCRTSRMWLTGLATVELK